MIVLEDGRGGAVLVAPTWRDRLAARLQPDALDRQLAAGTSPDANAGLSLRARSLTQMSNRRALARSAQLLADRTATASSRRRAAVRVRPGSDALSGDLRILASRLVLPGLVAPRGVAKASALLSKVWGPGTRNAGSEALRVELRDAIESLDAAMQP